MNKAGKVKPPAEKNRNGVPVIGENQDLNAFFESVDDNDIKRESKTKSAKPAPSKPVKKKKSKGRQLKNGLPVLNKNEDIEALLLNSSVDEEFMQALESRSRRRKKEFGTDDAEVSKKKSKAVKKDKNGLPILDSKTDYLSAFDDGSDDVAPPEEPPVSTSEVPAGDNSSEENFAVLLEKSLGGKSGQTLLREKKEKSRSASVPLSLKERLRRYPAPQGQLDLHGYTAVDADRKADSWLRSAHKNGIFTVRIIVGKGLHSSGPAVLPDVIEERLIHLRHEGLVLAYEWEKKKKAKSGAVNVYLKYYE